MKRPSMSIRERRPGPNERIVASNKASSPNSKRSSATSVQRSGSRDLKPRRATLVVSVLVCLLVTASLAVATTHTALRWRRSQRWQHQMYQTELLLDAGILRAATQLARSKTYRGEIWRPSQESVDFESPQVEIRVRAGDSPDSRQVEVVAQLGSPLSNLATSNVSLTRRSHSFSVSPLP